MSICDNCIHDYVCGLEDNHEDGLIFCADMISKTGWIPEEQECKMAREEAIERLKSIKSLVDKYDDVMALREAIKALEQEQTLDKIRAEFISLYPKNYAGEPELGGSSCEFSLNKVLNVIDKYKAESEE